jgi:hypothetical protein
VCSLHSLLTSLSRPQTTAKVRGFSVTASGFTAETDWLLEESGFEPLVPLNLRRRHLSVSKRMSLARRR